MIEHRLKSLAIETGYASLSHAFVPWHTGWIQPRLRSQLAPKPHAVLSLMSSSRHVGIFYLENMCPGGDGAPTCRSRKLRITLANMVADVS